MESFSQKLNWEENQGAKNWQYFRVISPSLRIYVGTKVFLGTQHFIIFYNKIDLQKEWT